MCACLEINEVKLTDNDVATIRSTKTLHKNHRLSTKEKIGKKNKYKKIVTDIHVRAYMLVDYSLFMSWKNLGYLDFYENVDDITFYYAHALQLAGKKFTNMKKGLYNYIISVAGIEISQSKESSKFIELEKAKVPNSTYVRYSTVLHELKKWIMAKKAENMPLFEVLFLFTSYRDVDHAGLTRLKSACSDRASVVARHGPLNKLALLLSHELGHVLGARHDGDLNNCNAEDGHIMSPKIGGFKFSPNRTFSECSRKSMNKYITLIKRFENDCFEKEEWTPEDEENKKKRDKVWNEIEELLPGARFSPDRSCQIFFGKGSHFCGGKVGNSRDICHKFKCFIPEKNKCILLDAAMDGIACGNKMWCVDGSCKYDERAPVKKEDCMFGDMRGPFRVRKISYQCWELHKKPSLCYHPNVKGMCCATCHALERPEPGCPYGDKGMRKKGRSRILSCTHLKVFPHFCRQYFKSCCRTCLEIHKLL